MLWVLYPSKHGRVNDSMQASGDRHDKWRRRNADVGGRSERPSFFLRNPREGNTTLDRKQRSSGLALFSQVL